MQGRAIAPVTRGWTSEGPGPIRVRTGGLNEVMLMLSAFGDSKKIVGILPEILFFNQLLIITKYLSVYWILVTAISDCVVLLST